MNRMKLSHLYQWTMNLVLDVIAVFALLIFIIFAVIYRVIAIIETKFSQQKC